MTTMLSSELSPAIDEFSAALGADRVLTSDEDLRARGQLPGADGA